ncbi:unnamed protein product [Symbiodinium necroappetens]|uniref:Uncharacterized protein n=1 Tax=Symbiodinium necroappetens TaxID=1628268 RepID=A0A813A418_9DINO|nr:unnamed protein product [Symbiodinium necroappetens]
MLFALDPYKVKQRAGQRLRRKIKLDLERSALYLLSQMAAFADRTVEEHTRLPFKQGLRILGGKHTKHTSEWVNTVEADAACRNLIVDHHDWCNVTSGHRTSQPCVFGDILHQLAYQLDMAGLTFKRRLQLVAKESMARTQYCYTHGQQCPIMRTVDIDMSGLPCPDNSRANRKRKFEDIRMSMLEALLGQDYNFAELLVEPSHCGFGGTSRKRKYIFAYHKTNARYLFDVHEAYRCIRTAIQKTVQTRPRDYFVADQHQLQAHAARLAALRRIPVQDTSDMYYLLNGREKIQVQTLDACYRERSGHEPKLNQDLVYFLGDNASFTKCWSAVNNRIPTFRTNSANFWIPSKRRLLVTADKMSALGFPVCENSARSMGVAPVPCLDPRRGAKVLGNSMHLINATVVLFIALTCFGRDCEAPGTKIDWPAFKRQCTKFSA